MLPFVEVGLKDFLRVLTDGHFASLLANLPCVVVRVVRHWHHIALLDDPVGGPQRVVFQRLPNKPFSAKQKENAGDSLVVPQDFLFGF